jgi:hypothetical protein
MSIQFVHERHLKIPCGNTLCNHQGNYNGNKKYDGNCDIKDDEGNPKYLTCSVYFPEANSKLIEPCECFEAVFVEGWHECLKCKKLFWM